MSIKIKNPTSRAKQAYLLIVCVVLLFSACGTDEDTSPESESIHYTYTKSVTVQYRSDVTAVSADLLSYDVYYNDTLDELCPVIIWVHGGGWSIGDKAKSFIDKRKYFESLGYVLFSINYRLTPVDAKGEPSELLNNDRVKFPDHPQDVASAISHIYQNIANYGGDKERIVILGHSAGAHLSMLVSTDTQYLVPYGLDPRMIFKGVASFDTESYDITQHFLDFGVTGDNGQATIEVDNFLDDDPGTPYHTTVITYLNAFGKNEKNWDVASPINHLNHKKKPTKYFFYYQDVATSNQKRFDIIDNFVSTLRDDGNYVVACETPHAHEVINHRIGQSNEMTSRLTDFLCKCFE